MEHGRDRNGRHVSRIRPLPGGLKMNDWLVSPLRLFIKPFIDSNYKLIMTRSLETDHCYTPLHLHILIVIPGSLASTSTLAAAAAAAAKL